MKSFGILVGVIALIALSFLSSLLGAHVLLSIAGLYGLSFITNFSFVQIVGLLIIIGILKFKYKKSETEDNSGEFLTEGLTAVVSTTVFYLLTWGLAFLAFGIIS